MELRDDEVAVIRGGDLAEGKGTLRNGKVLLCIPRLTVKGILPEPTRILRNRQPLAARRDARKRNRDNMP